MNQNTETPQILAPVMGGLRWRRPMHDIADACRRCGGFNFRHPDDPIPNDSPEPEPGAILTPLFTSTPPEEGRVGAEYVYQARAFDNVADGFTWYFKKSAPGMTVDRYTGRVSWTPSEGGYVEVVLCARSVYGAESRQSWTVCVRKAAPARVHAPNPRYREALRRKAARTAAGIVTRPFLLCWRVAERADRTACRPAAPPADRPLAAMPLRL